MNLKRIVLNERSQTPGSIHVTFWKRQARREKHLPKLVVVRGWGWAVWLTTKEYERAFWGNGTVLYLDCGVFTQCLCLPKIIQLYFKKGVFTPCKLYTNKTD